MRTSESLGAAYTLGIANQGRWEVQMSSPELKTSDIQYHLVTFGVDLFPPIDLEKERTRLHLFYENARNRWENLYDKLIAGSREFQIGKEFRQRPDASGSSMTVQTFTLTDRGLAFAYPLRLPSPVGDTGLEARFLEYYREVHQLISECVPGHDPLRVGLVRDLVFETGNSSCLSLVAGKRTFAGATLAEGVLKVLFRDEKYNHHVWLEPVTVARATHHPIGTTVTQQAGYGIKVRLDVNFANITGPLDQVRIDEMIDRATSLFPEKLLDYLNEP